MAELASGAVSSLLGVIRNEALLLGTVRHDVQFIREEMESMQSFLTHLSRKAPADGEHDEQIRTWMNQVRLLAQDSNNCIDMYLYRGNPELHLASGGLRRYIAWLPWFVQKMVAQHRAAIQLRVLRERARDIGERRVRYGVEVPVKEAAVEQSPTAADVVAASVASGDEEEEDDDDQLLVAKEAADHSGLRGAFFEPRTPEDNFRVKLAEWMEEVVRHKSHNRAEEELIPSLAVVAPDKEGTLAIAKEASAMWKKDCTRRQSVFVDIPAVHFYLQWLGTEDILYYILRALQSAEPQRQQQEGQDLGEENLVTDNVKSAISSEKQKLFEEIWEHIQGMKVDEKISEIKSTIKKMKGSQLQLNLTQMNGDDLGLLKSTKDEPIGVFLRALWLLRQKSVDSPPATKQGQERKEATRSKMKEAKLSYEYIIKETAKKLKEYMEADTDETPKPKDHIKEEEKERACAKKIHLKEANYEHILREMFPPVTNRKSPQIQEQDSKQATAITTTGTTILLVEDQFKEMIRKILQELQEDKSMKQPDTIVLQEVKSEKKPGTGELLEGEAAKKQEDGADGKPSEDCIPDDLIEETREMLPEIRRKIYWQLGHKGIMQRIKDYLKGQGHQKILVILKLDNDYVSGWEETRNAFSIIGCIAGVLMLTTEVNMERATEYCCPPREPIHCSLHGLYRDIVLDLTRKQIIGDSLQKIYLDILDKCKQHEFSMKIIVHALYANPRRSNEDLRKLRMTMKQVDKNSFNSIDKKMFKFSYSDLPKDYKSCLLYLSIFPKRQSIRRSTLIGRWVVEGLITKEDWASSVSRANRCFDALVDRWFVYPGDIGSTGEVKSCVIGDLVHGFITKIARKQRIVETRVSHHLARHFSIFNNLRLRRSDKIDRFFQKLYEESFRVSLIKVLDLEGCQCFGGKSRRYIKDICRTMLLLKYLSLRGTNLTQLPSEINNLRELEVLDIRQTSVHESATVNVLLLKLKRLLTGPVVPSSEPGNTKISCVMVPNKIGKMLNMEILSNVKARTSQDLRDIGKLWQLRKLGVVIEHREGGVIRNLIRAISDLHECLKCLTIILPLTEQDRSDEDFPSDVTKYYKQLPRLLESLSITGTTKKGQLLKLLTKHNDLLQLAKITLAGTLLKQADLKVLAKLPKIVCLRLRDKAYMDRELTFREEEFKNLRCFLVEGSNMTNIIFEGGALHLEKIVLCSTDSLQSLSGVEGLQDLKEVELNNSNKLQLFAQSKNISKVTIRSTTLSQGEVQILTKIPNMLCLVLKENSYAQSHIVFNKDDFPRLSLLIVDFSVTPKISFTVGSAPKLEKIVCSFAKNTEDTLSVSGIDILPKLKELEFNGNPVPRELKEALKDNKNKPELVHNKPENQYQETGNILQRGDAARFPLCWKSQV